MTRKIKKLNTMLGIGNPMLIARINAIIDMLNDDGYLKQSMQTEE